MRNASVLVYVCALNVCEKLSVVNATCSSCQPGGVARLRAESLLPLCERMFECVLWFRRGIAGRGRKR